MADHPGVVHVRNGDWPLPCRSRHKCAASDCVALTPLASLRMVDCMSISNDVSLGAINHSQLMRGIVQKYRMKYRWGIRKYGGVSGPRGRRATTCGLSVAI